MILLKLMIIYAAISPVISLLWVNSLFFDIQFLVKIVHGYNILIFLISFSILIYFALRNKLQNIYLFIFFILLLSFDIIGLFLGYANGYNNKNIADFYTLMNGITLTYVLYLIKFNDNQINKFIKQFVYVYTLFFSISITVMQIESFLGIPFYPAIASNFAVISFLYFIYKKQYKMAIFTFILILISGKRSVFIVFVALLPIFYLLNKKLLLSKVLLIGSSFSLLFIILLLPLHLFLESNIESLPFGKSAISKFSYINPMAEKFNLEVAAGERFEEVDAALMENNKNIFSFFIGSGNGFVYPLDIERKDMFEENRHNVHFSPITYFTRYGIIFVIIFYSFFIMYFAYITKYIKYATNSYKILVFYQIFAFIMSFISFSLSLDFFFWISIGLTLQMRYRIKQEFKKGDNRLQCAE